MSKTALITGAISRIGKATACEIAKQNIRLILCGRRQERLEALQAEDIAEIIYFAVSRPLYLNITNLLVFPIAQENSTAVKKSKR